MRKLRDVFYINAFPENNEIVYYGMEFKEFIQYAPLKIDKFLLIKSEFYNGHFSKENYFTLVSGKQEVDRLLNDNVYIYGDFCWVDYNSEENVENLNKTEIAELLYLGHMFMPMESPFLKGIENRYAYLAHDDGWFCRVYCKSYDDFGEIIANKLVDGVTTSRRKIYPISDEIKDQLIKLSENGLLFDFDNIYKDKREIQIHIYTIGKFLNMDDMYNGLKQHIGRAKYSACLVYKNKGWTIDYISEK